MRLLIVDDNRIERMILKEMLESEDYTVEEAENRAQAMEMARREPPDMIISDILMPVMDGFRLCHEIRTDNRTCDIPFVFYTGTYTQSGDKDLAFKMGADQFLVKTMGWEVFFKELLDVIKEKELGGEFSQSHPPTDGKEIYQLYNERLIKKLEEKVIELEKEVGCRKKLEKQLYDSQGSLQLALDGANLGMWDWNVQTGEVKFNQQLAENFGYEAHELFPHVDTWIKMIHPDDRQKTMAELKANLDGNTAFYENEHRILTKDGKWHWFLARGKVVGRDDAGNPFRHMGTFLDIHEHKAALKELEKEKEKYRLIFNTAPIGILHYNNDGVVTECNPVCLEMIGASREKLIGLNIFEKIRNENLIQSVKTSLSGETVHAQGGYTSVTGGRKFYAMADLAPITSPDEKIQGGICVVRDVTANIQAKKALKKSEEKYRTILESIEDGYYEVDLSGNLMFFNNSLCEIIGYPESELKGKNYRSFMDKENADTTFQTFNKVFVSGKSLKGSDWQIIRKDGVGAYLDTSITVMKDASEEIIGFRGIARDVSERRLMEKFLAESEERFRLIVESAPVGIFSYDNNGIIQACNQAYVDINGSSYGKLIGFNLLKSVTNEMALTAVQKSLAGSTGHYEGEYTSVTGGRKSYIKAHFVPVFSEKTHLVGGMCVVEDLTDKYMAEQALRDSEEKYRGLTERSPVIIILIQYGGRPYYVSPSVTDVLGFLPEEVLGKLPGDFMSKEDEARVFRLMSQIVSGMDVDSFEVSMLKKDKTPVIIEWTLIPIQKGDVLDGFQAIGRDITEKKRAEEELKKSRRQLRALSKHLQQSREEERSGIAREIHDDLGQLLTVIKMDAAWLRGRIPEDKPELYEKADNTIALVDAAIQSVKQIVSDLRPGLLDDLGLAAAIEWQAGEYQKRSGIHINVSIEPEEIILEDNLSIGVFRICQEAMTNIVRHSRATDAWLDLIKDDKALTLVVTDNGIGIREKEMSKNKSFGLIGMRERAHSFGGEIKIFNIKDGGLKVDIWIPLRAEGN